MLRECNSAWLSRRQLFLMFEAGEVTWYLKTVHITSKGIEKPFVLKVHLLASTIPAPGGPETWLGCQALLSLKRGKRYKNAQSLKHLVFYKGLGVFFVEF